MISPTLEAAKAPSASLNRQKSLWPVVMVLGMLFLIAAGIAGYFYYQYRQSAQVADAKEIETLSQEIGKFMLLPDNETPTLATVTDREKLAEQPFFQKAENGDKVLIFSQNGRAILYRPSQKKIVDVTTVNVNQTTATPTSPAPEPPTPVLTRVALYNGSIVDTTPKVEGQLKQISNTLVVVTRDVAKSDEYEETIVIDQSGQNTAVAAQVAQALGGTVGTLPAGEVFPADADILVITGRN
jgi:hypothetical protein